MSKLSRQDLYSLENYMQQRKDFKEKVMAVKKDRRVHVGAHVTVYFENKLSMQYQIQEMLRVEKIFDPQGIQDELDTYNPLIPDGSNWKATLMIEYKDSQEREQALSKLIGIEDQTWVCVDSFAKVFAIADEDIPRQNESKTSAVHFLRFELTADMVAAVKRGHAIGVGIDHQYYRYATDKLLPETINSLANDLN